MSSSNTGVQLNNGDISAIGVITGAKLKAPSSADIEFGESNLSAELQAKITNPSSPSTSAYSRDVLLKRSITGEVSWGNLSASGISYGNIDQSTLPTINGTTVVGTLSLTNIGAASESSVNAKVDKPSDETGAVGKFLKKTETGTEWATVQSGPSIVTSFPATPLDTNVPSTKLVKDSLDAKFDKAGGTISGDAYITGRLDLDGYLHAASGLSSGDTIQTSGLEVNEVDFFTWLGQRLADNTDDYSSSSSYSVGSFCKYDGALYVCKTAIGSGGEDWTEAHWTAMPNVSNLFSGANTSLVNTIRYEIAADNASVVEGETVMVDRTINKVTMAADVTLAFPTKPSGKARDFLLVLTATTASQLGLPTGVTTSGDTFSFTAGKTYLIAFTEIGVKAVSDVNKDWFYVRSIEL